MRKYIDGFDDTGVPLQQPFRRGSSELITRVPKSSEPERKRDTLGVEPVEVPKGTFNALRELRHYKESTATQVGDSTVYFELTEEHTYWWSDKIPITGLVRLDQENTQRRRVWMIGESANAPMRIVEHTTGGTQLLDFGTGMKARCIPARLQRPLSEQQAPARKRPPPAGPRKAAGTRG